MPPIVVKAGLDQQEYRPMLSDADLERYARQVIMPDVGEDGQERLLASRMLVVGAGGLGSPVMFYLAAAGVGHITILDDETVELTNLNRQILHTTHSIGTSKVDQATAATTALNPAIAISPRRERLDAGNVDELLSSHDLVIDCSDNVETRYLLGDAAYRTQKPLVFGGAVRSEGQLAIFHAGAPDSPCFRCVFPDMPDAQQAPGCSEAGILGPVTGVIGTLQALAAVNWILGIGGEQTGRLLLFDARGGGFMEISTARRTDCSTCGG
jgi:adenylyltransferase/sulfurtransferase